ncbi:hypothetical protein A2U01_0075459, partial [Trifolium medium]|nr:hypothetical protein [Trifolium medium]
AAKVTPIYESSEFSKELKLEVHSSMGELDRYPTVEECYVPSDCKVLRML